ncbi:MAG: chemotaxis protein CheW [Gemmatimonas sp.]|nr:chemotaxis protein CheW [Gemmatimonas sp.]
METLARSATLALPGRYLGFRLGGETYGLEIGVVQEIAGMLPVTRVPGSPAHVRGVVNLRGRVVPVVDLRTLFGMEPAAETRRTCLVVCRVEDGTETVVAAAVADDVTEVMRIDGAAAPPATDGAAGACVVGLAQQGDRVVILLDATRLFVGAGGTGGGA